MNRRQGQETRMFMVIWSFYKLALSFWLLCLYVHSPNHDSASTIFKQEWMEVIETERQTREKTVWGAFMSAKPNGNTRGLTLHSPPFRHWPWQSLTSAGGNPSKYQFTFHKSCQECKIRIHISTLFCISHTLILGHNVLGLIKVKLNRDSFSSWTLIELAILLNKLTDKWKSSF